MHEAKKYDLLFVGRFQRSKGLDVLLEALALTATMKGEIYKLGIVGPFSTEQRNYLLHGVPSAMKGTVTFLGSVHRDALPIVINQSRIVVVPSRYESFGLPALEAIACGVPVVAARVGGLPEIVDESVGVLVEPNNPQALAEAIYDSLRFPELRERATTLGPAKASRYDWDVIAPELRRIIFD
jgi:glycosyltransferase involved in cell wall biosynthesis